MSRVRSSAQGCSPGRISSSGQSSLPGRTPPASAGSRPARRTEDLPLPDGPTTPSSGAPTSCATSSATSRSRPKKYVGVGRLERCQALERADHQAAAAGAAPRALRRSSATPARQLVLHRAEPRASGRGLSDERADAPLRLVARPLGGDLARRARGTPSAAAQSSSAGIASASAPGTSAAAIARTASTPIGPSSIEASGRAPSTAAVLSATARMSTGSRGSAPRQRVERELRVGVGRVDVVEHQQQRALGDARPVDRPPRRPRPGRRRRRRARRRRAGGPPPRARRRAASARSRAGR